MTSEQAGAVARQYLASPLAQRGPPREALKDYRGPIEPVLAAFRTASAWTESRKGEICKEHFTAPGLREKYPDDLLYFLVPERYDPAAPFGLLVFLHGGDGASWGRVSSSSTAPMIRRRARRRSSPRARGRTRGQGNNVIEVRTENVLSFSLWLHPKMVDFARPVAVVRNGVRKEHAVTPSLRDALRSYERKRDWGLLYHAELVINE